MKKAILIALTLALALTLCLSTTALAWGGFEFQESAGATAEGTTIKGYYGNWAWYLEFRIIEGQFHFSPNLRLSQPASLYELVDGEWLEILTFNTVCSGKASLVTD